LANVELSLIYAGVRRTQDDVVFIPLNTAKSRVLGAVRGTSRESMDLIVIKASDESVMPEVRAEATTLLRERHRLRRDSADDFSIQNPADVLTARQASLRTFALLLISIASVSLVVGGISIMNVMLVSVTERTQEIGLRMAMGARRRDIRRQFLIEAVTLALAGGFLGVMVGGVGAAIIGWQASWPAIVSCAFAAVVGVAFGFYPAHRASRLDPMVALRCE
jgi:putative ABC transport system permease protein